MNYIVDTNVLLEYPNFIKESGRRFVLTYSVIRELDSKKTQPGMLGHNSRMVSRYLDEVRLCGDLADGVDTPDGSWLIVVMDSPDLHTDDSLVQLGQQLVEQKLPCTILSNDILVRVKASCNGVHAEGYGRSLKADVTHNSIPEFTIPDRLVSAAFASGKLDGSACPEVALNHYALFRSDSRQNSTVVVFNDGIDLHVVGNKKTDMFGIRPKNLDQTCAFDALQRAEVPLVVLTGPAGSGKSLIAIAAAMDALLKQKTVDKIMFIRSPIPVGKDIGFMPGDAKEKMAVWAGPLMDNLEVLMKGNAKNLEMYFERGMIEVAPLSFLRGRSLNRTFVILDEGQGLSDHEMKTVATRIGEGSRLVITGDLQQIDNPRVSSTENGLSTIAEVFRGTKWAITLDLVKGERSDFSAAAAEML